MTDTAKPPSIYQPLDASKQEIRVLHLLPARDLDDPIRIDLKIVSLKDKPYYEALSYTWGDASDTTEIWIRNSQSSRSYSLSSILAQFVFAMGFTPSRIQVPITVTLHSALRRLRWNCRTRIIWQVPRSVGPPPQRTSRADALSINQADVAEKNEQVSIMGDIYQTAKSVKIWLGEDASPRTRRWRDLALRGYTDKEDEIAAARTRGLRLPARVSAATTMGWQAACIHEYREDMESIRQKGRAPKALSADVEITAIMMLALYDVLSRPWFTRLWVVQELTLAKRAEFMIGLSVVPFRLIAAASLRIQSPGVTDLLERVELFVHLLLEINSAIGLIPLVGHASTLFSLQHKVQTFIEEFVQLEAKQQQLCMQVSTAAGHERLGDSSLPLQSPSKIPTPVFMALAVLSSCGRQDCTNPRDRVYALLSIIPLRTHIQVDYTKTVEEVYVDTATALLQNKEMLSDILHYASLYPATADGIPSWVPDWRYNTMDATLSRRWPRVPGCYNASIAHEALVRDSRLEAKALRIDTIAECLPAQTPAQLRNTPLQERLQSWRHWLEDDTGEAFWTVVMLDAWEDGSRRLTTQDCIVLEDTFERDDDGTFIRPDPGLEVVKNLDEELKSNTQRPCRSDRRRVGAIGFRGYVGDEVHIIAGCRMPVILRPATTHGPKYYRFIELCYLHGTMDGEAVLEAMRLQGKEEAVDVFEDVFLV
ncbi:hypothetical protein LTR15_007091 [Elasticomyces elasticus]|nr:hypothetical protein LTR15_007091 [Elasticomyces elasticus]